MCDCRQEPRQKARQMKKNDKKVLPFRPPPPQPDSNTIIAQIGISRFSIHFEIEDLPSAPLIPPQPLLLLQGSAKKRKPVK